MNNDSTKTTPRKGLGVVFAIAVLSAVVGFAAVYGTLGPHDNKATAPDTGTVTGTPSAARAPALTGAGKLAGFVVKPTPAPLPEISFVDPDGQPKTLKDFSGKMILLNVWATWCAPCREEMPSLDRLQKELGSDKFEVLALAVDRGGVDAARKFLDSVNVEHLKPYADSSTRVGSALRVIGMPTTILIDAEGREIGRLPGPAEWDSPAAKKLIEAHLQ